MDLDEGRTVQVDGQRLALFLLLVQDLVNVFRAVA